MVYSWPLRGGRSESADFEKTARDVARRAQERAAAAPRARADSAVGARSRRNYRYRHLRTGGGGGPRSDRTGADAVVCRRRGDLRVRRALLCRVRVDGAGRRIGIHLCLRHARRALRVDHRLGLVPIRGRIPPSQGWSHLSGLRLLNGGCPLSSRTRPSTSTRDGVRWDGPGSTSANHHALDPFILVEGIRNGHLPRRHRELKVAMCVRDSLSAPDREPAKGRPLRSRAHGAASSATRCSDRPERRRTVGLPPAPQSSSCLLGFDSVSTTPRKARKPHETSRSASSSRCAVYFLYIACGRS